MIDRKVADRINQLLNNGFAFDNHLSNFERDGVERSLLSWYKKNEIESYIEEEKIYVVDASWQPVLTMEITKNSIYFNPREHTYLLDVIIVTLEFITETLVNNNKKRSYLPEEDDSTEEMPKEIPNFEYL